MQSKPCAPNAWDALKLTSRGVLKRRLETVVQQDALSIGTVPIAILKR